MTGRRVNNRYVVTFVLKRLNLMLYVRVHVYAGVGIDVFGSTSSTSCCSTQEMRHRGLLWRRVDW
jgi:hypothetical protein